MKSFGYKYKCSYVATYIFLHFFLSKSKGQKIIEIDGCCKRTVKRFVASQSSRFRSAKGFASIALDTKNKSSFKHRTHLVAKCV